MGRGRPKLRKKVRFVPSKQVSKKGKGRGRRPGQPPRIVRVSWTLQKVASGNAGWSTCKHCNAKFSIEEVRVSYCEVNEGGFPITSKYWHHPGCLLLIKTPLWRQKAAEFFEEGKVEGFAALSTGEQEDVRRLFQDLSRCDVSTAAKKKIKKTAVERTAADGDGRGNDVTTGKQKTQDVDEENERANDDVSVDKEAKKAGMRDRLDKLLAHKDIVARNVSPVAAWVALQKSNGVVNGPSGAKTALLSAEVRTTKKAKVAPFGAVQEVHSAHIVEEGKIEGSAGFSTGEPEGVGRRFFQDLEKTAVEKSAAGEDGRIQNAQDDDEGSGCATADVSVDEEAEKAGMRDRLKKLLAHKDIVARNVSPVAAWAALQKSAGVMNGPSGAKAALLGAEVRKTKKANVVRLGVVPDVQSTDAADTSVSTDISVLKEAENAGKRNELEKLLACKDIVAKGISVAAAWVALQKSGGVLNGQSGAKADLLGAEGRKSQKAKVARLGAVPEVHSTDVVGTSASRKADTSVFKEAENAGMRDRLEKLLACKDIAAKGTSIAAAWTALQKYGGVLNGPSGARKALLSG